MLSHSYTDLTGGCWMRGNLHAHTERSDGSRPAQEVIDDYAGRSHGFLMLSDHDVFTSSGDYAQLQDKGLILLPGNEISAAGPHILHVGASSFVEPDRDRQKVIEAIQATSGFAVLNHPNWKAEFDHCDIKSMREWQGYTGLEIYNGVIGRLHGSPYATNKWDMLLTDKRRVWGFANDDSHHPDDVGLGWNVAYVKDPTAEGVVQAFASGRFYGSTGVEIRDIHVDGNRIRIETLNARRVVALMDTGRRFAVTDDTSIEVEYPADARYVRFECWGDGERFAWTQPFWSEESCPPA
jgi:hypothetical protein